MAYTLKQSSSGRNEKGSFFSFGPTRWCRKLKVWLSHTSTRDVSHASFAAISKVLKMSLASLRMGSSSPSFGSRHDGGRCCGVGLGAGVGGEAGAEGSRGLEMTCGIAEGNAVFGVKGGLGCALCMESFLREDRWLIPTDVGGCRPYVARSLSESSEAGLA